MFCTSKNLYKYFHWPFWRGNNIFFAVSPREIEVCSSILDLGGLRWKKIAISGGNAQFWFNTKLHRREGN